MKKPLWLRTLPLLMALPLVATGAAPVLADEAQTVEQQYGVVQSDTREGRRLNDQLDQVVARIVRGINSERGRSSFQLRSARVLGGRDAAHDKVVNAFALPDGRIYVTLGLMRLIQDSSRSDDELAFVVGHEVTHVVEKHGARQQKKALPAMLGALVLGAVGGSTLGNLGQYGAAAYTSSFSRKDEYRADRGGLLAMNAAGYDPEAAVTMLNRLKSQGEESNRTVNGWFGSHPITSNRIARVQEIIRDLHAGRDPRQQ
jgi:predicted Zn-dependent protease